MAKKGGLLTLLLGAAAGAAAVLLSDKQNRIKAERGIQKASTKAKRLADDLENNPEKVARKVVSRGKKVAAVAAGKATVSTKTKKSKSAGMKKSK